MRNKFFTSSFLYYLLSILIPIIFYWRWFFTLYTYTWGDWGFYFPETVKEWFTFPQVWLNAFLGEVDIGLSQYLSVRFFYGGLAQFLPFEWIDRLVFLFPSVILPSLGIFILVKKITKNNIASLVSSIVYTFNTYILLLNTGHLTLAVSFGLAPFIFLLFEKTLINRSIRFAILTGFLGFVSVSYDVRGFYLIALILFIYYLFHIVAFAKKRLSEIFVISVLAALPIVLIVLLSSFWVLGFIKTSAAFEGIALDRQLFGNDQYIFPRAITLFEPFWTGGSKFAWSQIQPITLQFWLIPVFAWLGFWFNRKNKDVIFWTIVTLVGIFLVKMTGQPFGEIYVFLFNHFPGFNAFREPSKFDFYVSLGYAILIGFFVSWVLEKKISFNLKLIIISFVFVLFLYNGLPVFGGSLGKLLTPRSVPQDYLILKDFVQNQTDYFRVLYVPADSRWGYWDSKHPKLSATALVQGQWSKLNNYNKTGLEYSPFGQVSSIFDKPFANYLLDYSAVKYIVVPIYDESNEEVFIFPNGYSRNDYIKELAKQRYLKRIDIGTKDLAVYENKDFLPHYSVDNFASLRINNTSATQYNFTLQSDNKPVRLNFAETYSPDWKLRVGSFSWWNALWNKDYFLSDSQHNKTEFDTNEFDIPEVPSGTQITLFYMPQAYVNLGTAISLATLLLSLLVLWRVRK